MARYDPFSPDFEHPLLNSSPDFGSRIGTYRSRPIGDQKTPLSFRERSKRLRTVEDDKNQLIEDLLYQLESMQKELDQLQYDCTREKQYTMESQFRENSLQDQLRQVKNIMDREPFVVALIDGNDMLFTKDLLCKGEKGGIEAANRLSKAMNEFVTKSLPHLTSPKLVVKIYADFKPLVEAMAQLKIISSVNVLDEFVRGFNTTNPFFDLIDIGPASNCVSDRLCENVKLHLYDCHCHQVILGTSQNDALADLLKESLKDPYIVDHITILEGPPIEKGLAEIKSQVSYTQGVNTTASHSSFYVDPCRVLWNDWINFSLCIHIYLKYASYDLGNDDCTAIRPFGTCLKNKYDTNIHSSICTNTRICDRKTGGRCGCGA